LINLVELDGLSLKGESDTYYPGKVDEKRKIVFAKSGTLRRPI